MTKATPRLNKHAPAPSQGVILRTDVSEIGGRGVFSCTDLSSDVTIEIAPVIILRDPEAALLRQTLLYNYFFRWGESLGTVALCLGFGSLYNHSESPNVGYVKEFQREVIRFYTLRPIKAGEELFTDYHAGRRRSERYAFEHNTPRLPSPSEAQRSR